MTRSYMGYVSSQTTSTLPLMSYGVATLSGTGATSTTITADSASWTLLTAINDGTLSVTKAGLFDVCLVGGGGAGGRSQSNYGTSGGGGGGGVVRQTVYLAAGDYTVDVGAGGTSGSSDVYGASGKSSSIYSSTRTYEITAVGGGAGASPLYFNQAMFGGTGGGAKNNGTGGSAIQTQGYNGGNGGSSGAYEGGGGGGGGAGAVGSNGASNVGGNGGAGLDISTWLGQSATTTYKGGGGGGGGSGGNGTAGSGNGSANTGGGGVGRASTISSDGAAGYSGIAYVRFK